MKTLMILTWLASVGFTVAGRVANDETLKFISRIGILLTIGIALYYMFF